MVKLKVTSTAGVPLFAVSFSTSGTKDRVYTIKHPTLWTSMSNIFSLSIEGGISLESDGHVSLLGKFISELH
jgi:hypothetical protein